MKLSEAIREGAKLGPQVRGTWAAKIDTLSGMETVTKQGFCALGGAYWLVSVLGLHESGYGLILDTQAPAPWVDVLWRDTLCPNCKMDATLSTIIQHLNDDHLWSRERISEFVATQESEQEVKLFLMACRETAGQPLELESVE